MNQETIMIIVVVGLVIGAAIVIIEAIIAGSYDSQGGT